MRPPAIAEEAVVSAVFHLYYKLRHQGVPILTQLLADLQNARKVSCSGAWTSWHSTRKLQTSPVRIDCWPSSSSKGLLALTFYIPPKRAGGTTPRREAGKGTVPGGRGRSDDPADPGVDRSLEAGPDFLDAFDGELFRELVDKIIVESNDRLRFRLVNSLELTEPIERTMR